jgi:hypothetical protein
LVAFTVYEEFVSSQSIFKTIKKPALESFEGVMNDQVDPRSFSDTLNGRPKINYSTVLEASKSSENFDVCSHSARVSIGTSDEVRR